MGIKLKNKKLVIICSSQRSGTSLLIHSIANKDSNAKVFGESSEITQYHRLKPPHEVKYIINSYPEGTILIKPLADIMAGNIRRILIDYNDMDVWCNILYRDPVNVFQSKVEQKWIDYSKVDMFIDEYNCIFNELISIYDSSVDKQMVVVRYEDMTRDENVFWSLSSFLGLKGSYAFREDSQAGYKKLPSQLLEKIKKATSGTVSQLDKRRKFKPKEIIQE